MNNALSPRQEGTARSQDLSDHAPDNAGTTGGLLIPPPDPKINTLVPRMCLFNRHKPRSKDVTWDGTHYVGECERCHRAIRRVRHHVWLSDWLR